MYASGLLCFSVFHLKSIKKNSLYVIIIQKGLRRI
jgi:hypothetical protein